MVSEPANIEVSIGTYGLKKLVVNGQDLTESTKSVQINADVGAVPVVSIMSLPGTMEITGPGVVMVQSVSAKESLIDFLNKVDATYLERKSLDNLDFGVSPTESFLSVLKELANEWQT